MVYYYFWLKCVHNHILDNPSLSPLKIKNTCIIWLVSHLWLFQVFFILWLLVSKKMSNKKSKTIEKRWYNKVHS